MGVMSETLLWQMLRWVSFVRSSTKEISLRPQVMISR